MLTPIKYKQFQKDLKRVQLNSKKSTLQRIEDRLDLALDYLKNEIPLPREFKDHDLHGEYLGCRDCHILGDLVLIDKIDKRENTITLIRLDTHSELKLKEELNNN